MANSTFRDFTDRLLLFHGQQATADATEFNAVSTLSKEKYQARACVDRIHRMAMATPRMRFMLRQYTITTAADDNTYNFPTATLPSLLKENSWFNTTSGYGEGPLDHWTYEEYLSIYPEGQTVTGRPQVWFLYPPDGTNQEVIGFSPIPDAIYTIKFEAWIKAYRLSSATDVIAFPDEWEHVLETWCSFLYEVMLGQNKEMNFAQALEFLQGEMKANTVGPPEDSPMQDVGIEIYSRRGVDSCRRSY